jgi:hypothetical protein
VTRTAWLDRRLRLSRRGSSWGALFPSSYSPILRKAGLVRELLLVVIALVSLGSAAASSAPPTFPRLAGGVIGNPHNYWDSEFQRKAAKLDFLIINSWPGWGANRNTSLDKVVREMKARNPNLKIFVYIAINELHDPPGRTPRDPVSQKADQAGWWLYRTGAGGERVVSAWGGNYYEFNTTRFTPRDSSGRNFLEWHADWVVEQYALKAPQIDGFYIDNFFVGPRVNGDWNRDGITDSQRSEEVQRWFREGYVSYVARLRQKLPGKLVLGNIGDFGKAGTFPEYQGLLDGGWGEGMLGFTWSTEAWGSFREMMEGYRRQMSRLRSSNLYLFHQDAAGKTSDYRSFRYGFAAALMDNGHYFFSEGGSSGYGTLPWFDEFDVKLGAARSGPQSTPWSKGVFRRDFENGVALVNPKGNGRVEVDLGEDFRRIAGNQDRAVNSGQGTRRVVLEDRDGIILLRVGGPRARPTAPSGLTVQ